MKKDIEQQFLQIWNDYHDEIYRYVISMLSDTGEAEECTQDHSIGTSYVGAGRHGEGDAGCQNNQRKEHG